jgi:hypothetical protein
MHALIPQAPGIVGVLIVVVFFLVYLERADRQRSKAAERMGSACHEIQMRSLNCLERNTESLGRGATSMDRVERAIEQCERR